MRDTIDINSNDNVLFITSQCNNRCLMCCQPPNNNDDLEHNYIKNIALVNSAPLSLPSLGITGGEPTLLGDKLFTLINHIKEKLPDTEIHLLTNGRAFADLNYTKKLMQCGTEKILLGIPIHSDCSIDHDYITQTIGSFDETMLGLYNLERCGFDIELRIVLNKITCQRLSQIANFIYRNLPFVRYVAFMGIEYTGYTIKNHKLVWIDPLEYQSELENAVCELSRWGIDVSVFNLPHCVLSKALWKFSVKSISDWKNEYAEFCDECSMKNECCGLFSTSRKHSIGLRPINLSTCD